MRKRDISKLEKVVLTASVILAGTLATAGFVKGCDYVSRKAANPISYIEDSFVGRYK